MTTAPTMYLFTGRTDVERTTTWRYSSHTPQTVTIDSVTVTVLATDQADAEQSVSAMLSTPADTPDRDMGDQRDAYARTYTWTSVEQAPAGTADAEQLRQELARTMAALDEAQSAGRLALQQADAERGAAEYAQDKIARVYALHVPAGSPAVCQHCNGSQGTHPAFPCETIRALAPEDDE